MTTKNDEGEGMKLLPCPFCETEGWPVIHNDTDTKPKEQTHISYWVYCVGCAAEGSWAETPEEAVKKWNTRRTASPEGGQQLPKECPECSSTTDGIRTSVYHGPQGCEKQIRNQALEEAAVVAEKHDRRVFDCVGDPRIPRFESESANLIRALKSPPTQTGEQQGNE